MLWWKRFGLEREPKFAPRAAISLENAYLFVIPRDKTLANKVFSQLENPRSFYHNVYGIVGDYGSGKTSLVNYIRYHFHSKSIKTCNLNILWHTRPKIKGPHEVRDWFIEEIREALIQACEYAVLAAPIDQRKNLETIRNELSDKKRPFGRRQIGKCISHLCQYYDGCSIFIDELHRLRSTHEQGHVLDFLMYEQGTFSTICEYPASIFIACPTEWLERLKLDQYGGIFDELIVLPSWKNAQLGYDLIDKRLRSASVDPSKFKNPIRRNALNKIAALPHVETPRGWIKQAKKIFDNLPEDVHEITPEIVAEIIKTVDSQTFEKIRTIARVRFPSAFTLINKVLKRSPHEASELLGVIAHIYHKPLNRGPSALEKDMKNFGIENLIWIRELEDLDIIFRDTIMSPPIKSGHRTVEIHQRKVYRLNNKLTEFFRRIEEMGYDPEDYILRFEERKVVSLEKTDVEHNIRRLKLIEKNLEIPRAKNHIRRVMEDYDIFIKSVFSTSIIERTAFRSGIIAIKNLVCAFSVENTKNEDHVVDVGKDLMQFQKILSPETGKAIVPIVNTLLDRSKEIEGTGKPITESISIMMKTQVLEIINQMISQLDRWVSLHPTVRDHKKMLEKIEEIQSKISRGDVLTQSQLRENAIDYLKDLSDDVDERWIRAFFKVLKQRGSGRALIDIVNTLGYRAESRSDQTQAYKIALKKLGSFFDNILDIIGQSHSNPKIRKTFSSPGKLSAYYKLTRIFEDDEVLKQTLKAYASSDKNKDLQEFESNIQRLLSHESAGLPSYARYLTLVTLVKSYYGGDGCQDTIANTDERIFMKIMNGGLSSILNVFKFHIDREKILFPGIMELRRQTTLITPDDPFKNRILYEKAIMSCDGFLHWIDKYFSEGGLAYLKDSIASSIEEIKILTSASKATEKLRNYFKDFRKSLRNRDITCEMRVITDQKLERDIHDRWILSRSKSFNLPSPDTIARGQYSEIKETNNRPPFDEMWNHSADIITDWDKIKVYVKARQARTGQLPTAST